MSEHAEHHINYTRIYIILLVLLIVSIIGPEIGIRWLTLVTAFGIALVKANLVIQNFMHLRTERRIMKWLLAASLVLMFLMFFAVAPDVMRHTGTNWQNDAAQAAIERGIGGGEHGGEAAH